MHDRCHSAPVEARLLITASGSGDQLVARQPDALSRTSFVDPLFVGRLLARLLDPGVLIRNDLMYIPKATVLRSECLFGIVRVSHAAILCQPVVGPLLLRQRQ